MLVVFYFLLPTIVAGSTGKAPVSAEKLQTITEATAYRHQGDGLQLEGETLSAFQTMMAGLSVKEDILEQSRSMDFDDSREWYCVDAVLADGETVRFAFFHREKGLIPACKVQTLKAYDKKTCQKC